MDGTGAAKGKRDVNSDHAKKATCVGRVAQRSRARQSRRVAVHDGPRAAGGAATKGIAGELGASWFSNQGRVPGGRHRRCGGEGGGRRGNNRGAGVAVRRDWGTGKRCLDDRGGAHP